MFVFQRFKPRALIGRLRTQGSQFLSLERGPSLGPSLTRLITTLFLIFERFKLNLTLVRR